MTDDQPDLLQNLVMRAWVAVLLLAGTVAACTSSGTSPSVVTTGVAPASPYAGPMHLPMTVDDEAPVTARSGAAARALECAGTPYDGAAGLEYRDGLLETRSSPAAALAEAVQPNGFPEFMPSSGYRVERTTAHRVLFSWDVAGQSKVAIVAADGITDYKHHTGWGIEAWAQCDPAELPAATIDDLGLGIWIARGGARVPVATVASFPRSSWCDYDGTTYLQLGRTRQPFVHDPDRSADDSLVVPYAEPVSVPATARDTGYHRDGRELWTSADSSAVYLVATDDPTDVERWPAMRPKLGCG